MLPVEDQISILVHLSRADEYVAQEEKGLIHSIAKNHGLSEEEIEAIMEKPKDIPPLKDLPSDEKFQYLHDVIQLMKIDRKIHQKEINFCERLAIVLGYRPGVVAELSAYIYSDPSITTKRDYLRSIADQYMTK